MSNSEITFSFGQNWAEYVKQHFSETSRTGRQVPIVAIPANAGSVRQIFPRYWKWQRHSFARRIQGRCPPKSSALISTRIGQTTKRLRDQFGATDRWEILNHRCSIRRFSPRSSRPTSPIPGGCCTTPDTCGMPCETRPSSCCRPVYSSSSVYHDQQIGLLAGHQTAVQPLGTTR